MPTIEDKIALSVKHSVIPKLGNNTHHMFAPAHLKSNAHQTGASRINFMRHTMELASRLNCSVEMRDHFRRFLPPSSPITKDALYKLSKQSPSDQHHVILDAHLITTLLTGIEQEYRKNKGSLPAHLKAPTSYFLKQTEQLLKQHHKNASAGVAIVKHAQKSKKTPSNMVQHLEYLSNSLQGTWRRVEDLTTAMASGHEAIESFKTAKDMMAAIINAVQQFNEATWEDIPQLAESILDQVNKTVTVGVDAASQAKSLFDKLQALRSPTTPPAATAAPPTPETADTQKLDLAKAQVQVESAMAQQTQSNTQAQTTLTTVEQGICFLETLARQISPEAGDKIAIAGKAATIGKSIATVLTEFGAGTVSIGSSLPYVVMSSAALGLLMLLKNVHGNNQNLLKGLQELAQQTKTLVENIDVRFNHVEMLLTEFHRDAIQHFASLADKIDGISATLAEIEHRFMLLDEKVDAYASTLHHRDYREKSVLASRLIVHQSTENASLVVSKFLATAVSTAKDDISAGAALPGLHERDIAEKLARNPEGHINLLLACAKLYLAGKITSTRIINPVCWADAALQYMNVIYHLPMVPADEGEVNQILQAGQELKKFIHALKTEPALFIALIKKYLASMNAAQQEIEKIICQYEREKAHPAWFAKAKLESDEATLEVFRSAVKREVEITRPAGIIAEMKDLSKTINALEANADDDFREILKQAPIAIIMAPKPFPLYRRLMPISHQYHDLTARIQKHFDLRGNTPQDHLHEYLTCHVGTDYRHEVNQRILAAAINRGAALYKAIEKMDTYYKLLAAILSFAFRENYLTDPSLRSGLWQQQDFRRYLESYNPEQGAHFIFFHLQENILKMIALFEERVLQLIAQAQEQLSKANHTTASPLPMTGYSLLDDTLEQLELFKVVLLSTPTPRHLKAPHPFETSGNAPRSKL